MGQAGSAKIGRWSLASVEADGIPSAHEEGEFATSSWRTMNVSSSRHPLSHALGMRRLLESQALAWLVLITTLLLTIWLWRYSEADLARRQQDRFLQSVENQRSVLINRMQDYEQVLRGGVALFAAKGMPSRNEWRIYIESLELDRTLPGILGTGFSMVIPAERRAAHERAVRAEGFPGYRIYPETGLETQTAIVYLEPFEGRNLRAFGFDMYSEPTRREAMARARDTGRPALSARVTLVQETSTEIQPGFLMYLPVYRDNMPRDTIEARRAALLGFVYSPFRSFDLLNNVFAREGRDLDVELFDGTPTTDNLLFSSESAGHYARHVIDMPLLIAGREWFARFYSTREFETSTASSQPTLVLFGGLALDFMLFAVLYIHARYRLNMREAATKLEYSVENFRTLVENIPGAVFRSEVGSAPAVVQLSQGIRALSGAPRERFLSGELCFANLIHPEDKSRVQETIAEAIANRSAYGVEYRIRAIDGFTRWVSERGRSTVDIDGKARWLDGVILDITERKAAEIMIRDLAFNDTLTGLPNRRLLLDRLDHQLAASERTGQRGALLFIDLDDFKAINDTFGHEAGDQVLIEVAGRLLAQVRESDTVARLGGDEFVVVLDNLGQSAAAAAAEAAELGSKLREQLSLPYRFGTAERSTTPSIGVTVFCGHTYSADQLLRRADQAMYKAKSDGRNRVQFFDDGLDRGART